MVLFGYFYKWRYYRRSIKLNRSCFAIIFLPLEELFFETDEYSLGFLYYDTMMVDFSNCFGGYKIISLNRNDVFELSVQSSNCLVTAEYFSTLHS